MPFGNISETSFFLPRMAGLLMGGGTGFDQAAKGMGAMPFMTPEQAQQMMQSPGVRQMLQAYGLAPTENIRQSPFFPQGFMQHHPKLGGALSGAMANIAMTPEAPLVSGAGSGMSRAMQGLAGGPEMLRKYQTGQIFAPMQALGMMMPATGGQIFRQLVEHVMGGIDLSRDPVGQRMALLYPTLKPGTPEFAAKYREEELAARGHDPAYITAQATLADAKAKLTEANIQLTDAKSTTEAAKAQKLLADAQTDVLKAQAAATRADMARANKTQKIGDYEKGFQTAQQAISNSQKALPWNDDPNTWTPQQKALWNSYADMGNAYYKAMGSSQTIPNSGDLAKQIPTAAAPALGPGLWQQIKQAFGFGGSQQQPQTPGARPEPPRPANVPKDYIFKWDGPKGAGYYKP